MSENNDVLEFRLSVVEKTIVKIEQGVDSIADSLQTLARIEAHQSNTADAVTRCVAALESHDERLRHLESEVPITRLVRNWVIAGVIGVVALVGVAVIQLPPAQIPPPTNLR